jgi:hypothetical protein
VSNVRRPNHSHDENRNRSGCENQHPEKTAKSHPNQEGHKGYEYHVSPRCDEYTQIYYELSLTPDNRGVNHFFLPYPQNWAAGDLVQAPLYLSIAG